MLNGLCSYKTGRHKHKKNNSNAKKRCKGRIIFCGCLSPFRQYEVKHGTIGIFEMQVWSRFAVVKMVLYAVFFEQCLCFINIVDHEAYGHATRTFCGAPGVNSDRDAG